MDALRKELTGDAERERSRAEAAEAQLAALRAEVKALEASVESLQAQNELASQQIERIRGASVTMKLLDRGAQLAAHADDVEATADKVRLAYQSLYAENCALRAQLADIRKGEAFEVAALRARVAEVEAQMDAMLVGGPREEVMRLRARVQALEASVAEMEGKLTHAWSCAAVWSDRLNKLAKDNPEVFANERLPIYPNNRVEELTARAEKAEELLTRAEAALRETNDALRVYRYGHPEELPESDDYEHSEERVTRAEMANRALLEAIGYKPTRSGESASKEEA